MIPDWMNNVESFLSDGPMTIARAARRSPCDIQLFLTTRFQLGSGQAAIEDVTDLKLLGNPLEFRNYTGRPPRTIEMTDIYEDEDTLLATQATAPIYSKGVAGVSLVHMILLREGELNGNVINEIGLFVDNPFYKVESVRTNRPGACPPWLGVIGQDFGGSDFGPMPQQSEYPTADQAAQVTEVPGSLLAAYRKFPEITKESDFSIIFRWSIEFKSNCPGSYL